LTLEEYSNIGKKRASMLKGDRPAIYELFLKYEKEKKRLFLYDESDAVFHIYSQIVKFGYQGSNIHSFTVDEVQDCSEAMLQLLFLISNNPNGFFFCGDTAQTIEQGMFIITFKLYSIVKQVF
jgi:superfamily I DNA/RNA helicase